MNRRWKFVAVQLACIMAVLVATPLSYADWRWWATVAALVVHGCSNFAEGVEWGIASAKSVLGVSR